METTQHLPWQAFLHSALSYYDSSRYNLLRHLWLWRKKKKNNLQCWQHRSVTDLQVQQLSLAWTASSSSAKTHSSLKASKFNPYCCLERTSLSKQPSPCLNSTAVGQRVTYLLYFFCSNMASPPWPSYTVMQQVIHKWMKEIYTQHSWKTVHAFS